MTHLFGLYFDGRMYTTMKNARNVARHGHRDIVSEELASIICEPDSSYFGKLMQSSTLSKETSEIFF